MSHPGRAPLRARAVPHVLAGALTAGALTALAVQPPPAVWVLALALGIGCAALTARGRPGAAVACLAAALAAVGWGWGAVRLDATAPVALALPGEAAGTVDIDTWPQAVAAGERVRVHAVALRIGDRPVPSGTRFLADLPQGVPNAGPGVRLRVVAAAREAAAKNAPGWWRAYLDRNLVAGRLAVRRAEPAGRRGGLAGLRDRLRFEAGIAAGAGLHGEVRAVVRGLALGGGSGLSQETAQDFRDAGIWHLLAVSGQNVAVIAKALFTLLIALGIRRRPAVCASLVLIPVYCLACDGGASVARAGFVGALGVVGELGSRRRDRWHLLLSGLAALVVAQPRSIGDPGLQLSFAAVVGMHLVADPAARWLGRAMPGLVASLIGQAAGASLATAPVIVWHFGSMSLAGLVVNLVAVPLATPIVIGALAGVVAGWLLPAAGVAVNAVAGVGGSLLITLAKGAAAVPGASVTLSRWSAPLMLVPFGLTVTALRLGGSVRPPDPAGRRRRPAVALAAAVVAAVVAAAVPGAAAPAPWPVLPAMTALDIGQGDAILLRSPDGAAVLIDTGPPGDPAPVLAGLRRHGVRRLALLALTHDQADHAGAAAAVLDRVAVAAVASPVPVPAAEFAARRHGVPVRRLMAGDRLTAGAWDLAVLSPRAGAPPPEDPNDASLVVLALAPGITALLTADAESGVLSHLAIGHADVLKVSHHGSADAGLAALLARLRPAVAVISVGARNRYGHPDPATLTALAAAHVAVGRTDEGGDMTVSATPAGIALTAGR